MNTIYTSDLLLLVMIRTVAISLVFLQRSNGFAQLCSDERLYRETSSSIKCLLYGICV
jgi:hypothetical protein